MDPKCDCIQAAMSKPQAPVTLEQPGVIGQSEHLYTRRSRPHKIISSAYRLYTWLSDRETPSATSQHPSSPGANAVGPNVKL